MYLLFTIKLPAPGLGVSLYFMLPFSDPDPEGMMLFMLSAIFVQ
jgi:hypothetical protein